MQANQSSRFGKVKTDDSGPIDLLLSVAEMTSGPKHEKRVVIMKRIWQKTKKQQWPASKK